VDAANSEVAVIADGGAVRGFAGHRQGKRRGQRGLQHHRDAL
jgi:hypothetical protein